MYVEDIALQDYNDHNGDIHAPFLYVYFIRSKYISAMKGTFKLSPHIYPRVLSYICVFLSTATHA